MVRHQEDIIELVFTTPPNRAAPDGVIAVDKATWAVPVRGEDLDEAAGTPPFSGLSAIGTGCFGAMVLLNLATLRPFVITSTDQNAAQVVRAISLDLARSPMAQNVRLHLVGFGSELAAARPDRATYYEHLGLAVRGLATECRTHADSRSAAAPQNIPRGLHIVLCIHPAEQHHRWLAQALETSPYVTAVVAETHPSNDLPIGAHLDADRCRLFAGDASWMLTPRRVHSTEYAHAVARLPPAPGTRPGRNSNGGGRPVPIGDESPRAEIRVLGTPELTGIDTGHLSQAEHRKLNQTVQIICYLALNPGATVAQIARSLAPDARDPQGEIHSRISRARHLLGEQHLPKADNHRYRLHDIRVDRDEFYRYINRAQARTPLHAATDLEQALSYVRGRPFDDDTHGRYAWALPEAEAFLRDILTACHNLAELYLDTHQPRAAWHAARKALSLDELHPTATKDLFTALHALGETDQLYRARDHYEKTCARRGLPTDKTVLDHVHHLLHPPRSR